jgi:histidine triad (HIT) family protein
MSCIFCEIVAGRAPASIIHEDDTLMAFMTLRPFAPGECLIIPRRHVDHFTDLDDADAQRIIVLAQRIGRRMREVFKPRRVGMLVHGFGVPHAHFILVPQHRTDDLTSARFARIEDGRIVFDLENIPFAERATLDEHARLLAER